MGSALLRGWLVNESSAEIVVIEPQPLDPVLTPYPTVKVYQNAPPASGLLPCDVVVFAIKPQQFDAVVPDYQELAGQTLFVSIAAGKSIKTIASLLGNPQAAIVRAMPNLPALTGLGITGLVTTDMVVKRHRAMAKVLMKAVGEVTWLENERQLDAVTAISGSGPAYLFALCEALTNSGIRLGLPPETAAALARYTIIGAGSMLLSQPNEPASALREAVTSPGGTTEAALKVLLREKDNLASLIDETTQAAFRRANELSA